MDVLEHYRPPLFAAKKWTLVGLCLVFIVIEIVLAGFAGKIADHWIEEVKHERDYRYVNDIEAARKLMIIGVVVSSVIAILFQLMGVLGALREHLCLSATYAVLHLLGTVASLLEALRTPFMWGEFAWSLLITLLAVTFVRDLVLIRRQASHQYA